jgi:hypothetical protein
MSSQSKNLIPFTAFCVNPKPMKKETQKPNLLVELNNRKKEAQKAGVTSESFDKFKPNKPRNQNRLTVGPSWGGRKGN